MNGILSILNRDSRDGYTEREIADWNGMDPGILDVLYPSLGPQPEPDQALLDPDLFLNNIASEEWVRTHTFVRCVVVPKETPHGMYILCAQREEFHWVHSKHVRVCFQQASDWETQRYFWPFRPNL